VANLTSLPAFAEKNIFHVVVESPRGECVKLKYDPDLGVMSISRPLEGKDMKILGWAGFASAVKFVRASAARMPAK